MPTYSSPLTQEEESKLEEIEKKIELLKLEFHSIMYPVYLRSKQIDELKLKMKNAKPEE